MVYFDLPPEPAVYQPIEHVASERLVAQLKSQAAQANPHGELPPELLAVDPPIEPKNLLDEMLNASEPVPSQPAADTSANAFLFEHLAEPRFSLAQSGLPSLEPAPEDSQPTVDNIPRYCPHRASSRRASSQ